MLRNGDRISFRATLLAGVSGLALMGVITLPICAAKAQSNVLVNNGGPPDGSATTNVTISGAGNNLNVPGTVSGAIGNFATLGGTTPGGSITLLSSIVSDGESITGLRHMTATGTVDAGNVAATGNIAAVGTVSGASGNFATLGGTTPGGSITLTSSIISAGESITNLSHMTATGTVGAGNVTATGNIAAVGTVSGAIGNFATLGPVAVLCRSSEHILCSKGDEP